MLHLGNELLHVLPQELSTRMCDPVTPPATWYACPQRSLLLALPLGTASSVGVPIIGLDIPYPLQSHWCETYRRCASVPALGAPLISSYFSPASECVGPQISLLLVPGPLSVAGALLISFDGPHVHVRSWSQNLRA